MMADLLVLLVSFGLAMLLRLDSLDFFPQMRGGVAILIVAPTTLFGLYFLGVYRMVVRYMSSGSLSILAVCAICSALLLFTVSQTFTLGVPRSVPPIYAMLAFLGLAGIRLLFREAIVRGKNKVRTPVIIYGAGMSGRQLMTVLQRSADYIPVAFVDDAEPLLGTDIAGKRVYGADDLEYLTKDVGVKLVLLAIPRASRVRRKEIIEKLTSLSVEIRTIPSMSDIVSGRAQISDIREVALDDLLGRDPVEPVQSLMRASVAGKTVLVSGAGGSIGSELCRQIVLSDPQTLVLLDVSEPLLYGLEIELRTLVANAGSSPTIVPLLGSVQNPRRMTAILKRYKVDVVFHAAAYKHVPLVEQNTVEGLMNNVFGTQTLLEAAIEAEVGVFMLISTDKAVRPTNVMGASKRMAELVCQAYARETNKIQIAMVRFGNVLGSSGSVVPRFRSQIRSGGPITVTHPEITRYFMSIQEAAQLVIQASAMARGGDVFLLDMGKPVKIVDLASRMAQMSGLTPYFMEDGVTRVPSDGDIEIRFTSLRPGEKLYEELLIGSDAQPTSHSRIMTANETSLGLEELQVLLDALREACVNQDIGLIRRLLFEAPTLYQPATEVADLVWCKDATETVQ